MSTPVDSNIQEDLCTFPMYQRLRKINPYAYYSLRTQKQMQFDLRLFGSLTFFEQEIDTLPDPVDHEDVISLPKALSQAEYLIDTGSAEFNEMTETILGALYATDTVPIRWSNMNSNNHKIFAALIALMHTQSLKLEVDEYNTTDLQTFGYSKSFMQYLERADTRSVLNVINRTKHCAFYCVSEGIMGTLSYGDN